MCYIKTRKHKRSFLRSTVVDFKPGDKGSKCKMVLLLFKVKILLRIEGWVSHLFRSFWCLRGVGSGINHYIWLIFMAENWDMTGVSPFFRFLPSSASNQLQLQLEVNFILRQIQPASHPATRLE